MIDGGLAGAASLRWAGFGVGGLSGSVFFGPWWIRRGARSPIGLFRVPDSFPLNGESGTGLMSGIDGG